MRKEKHITGERAGGGKNSLNEYRMSQYYTIAFWDQANLCAFPLSPPLVLPRRPFQLHRPIDNTNHPDAANNNRRLSILLYYFISLVLEVTVYRLTLTLITTLPNGDAATTTSFFWTVSKLAWKVRGQRLNIEKWNRSYAIRYDRTNYSLLTWW